ncbi:MAG: DNA polymerase III subunit alpha, partial [Flavobacteriales bacterium]|nr:DNA polymerase III subunit alpha [Flavobacteriales bacterium]
MKAGVKPVAGIEFRSGSSLLYIGIAKNNDGFEQLNELLSSHLLDAVPLPDRPPELHDVFFIYPASHAPRQLRPNERVGIRPTDLARLPFGPWAARLQHLVALVPVTFRQPRDFNTHRLLRTMARNTVLSMLPADETASPQECFITADEVRRIYAAAPALVRNAEALLDQCGIAFDESDKTRTLFGQSRAHDREHLYRDTREGLLRRYPNPDARVIARMERELETIERMGFVSYFLINQDIVRFARSKGFFHVGRGSGANSLVAYCLGITDVDPIELDLYFERFISTARKKPPDFDIDFSWRDRDEVYRYVFDTYNKGKGGRHHVAQIATYTTFQWRGAIREVGKAAGLPPAEIDALSEGDTGYYARGRPSRAASAAGLDQVTRAVVRHARQLIGMPHHFGIHAGGILISERPLTHYSALHRPPKGFPVIQFSMLEAEDLGLHKFDLLSQRGLGHIRDAVELVNKAQDTSHKVQGSRTDVSELDPSDLNLVTCVFREAVDIHDIRRFKQDPAIKELLRTGNTIGCFYVESPAMRML